MSKPKQKRTLRLTVEVPDIWADDLDESAEVLADGDEVTPDDRLFIVVEEWFREEGLLTLVTLPGEKSQNGDFEVYAYPVRIVAADTVPR